MTAARHQHTHRMSGDGPDHTAVDPKWRAAAKARAVERGHTVRKFHRSTTFSGHVSTGVTGTADVWSASCRGCGLGLTVTSTRVAGPLVMLDCTNPQ